ncbi:MAG: rhomboid family intramembrane serine protease [Clostridia bacterium]|jgi:membrane associated rhomboid family serine protease|nr:rhomboid family intramembrane serine protease [Clostridia bacterium]
MIPLRDSTRSCSFPYVTVAIIILNLYIYFVQFTSNPNALEQLIIHYALIPARFAEGLQAYSWAGFLHSPLVTATFLHGSWFHVLFNMLYLWIFGDNIEDRLGHVRFLLFYLLAGVAGNIAHILLNFDSPIPLVGASGAIAGVLGAYFITFPRSKITTLFFVFFFIFVRPIPAIFFLFFWFVLQLANGLGSIGIMGETTAWWAHIGGFLAGIGLMLLLRKRNRSPYDSIY